SHSHARSSIVSAPFALRVNVRAVGDRVMGRGAYSRRDRRPWCACRTARAPWRLRVASASLAVQGIGPRVRLELPHPAPAARRVLDPLRRPAWNAATHRDGGAVLRSVPLRWSAALDVLREFAAVWCRIDRLERDD